MTKRYAESMTIQIAVKLPDELAAAADDLVSEAAFASRSDLARRAIEALVGEARRHADDEAYRRAYKYGPESEDDAAELQALSVGSIADEPWQRWW